MRRTSSGKSSSVVQSSAAKNLCRQQNRSKAIWLSLMEMVRFRRCYGLGAAARQRFANLLTSWGYVSLAVDSFATRNINEACDRPMPDRQADAWGAMLYLSKLSFVDRDRVAVVGSSQGGIVALRLASTQDVKILDVPDTLRFKAVVAYYPLCSVASAQLAVPALIMIGELDDWTPAKTYEQWMGLRNGRGAPVKLVVYPGADHGFDFPGPAHGLHRFGHLLKYNADAGAQFDSRDARLPGRPPRKMICVLQGRLLGTNSPFWCRIKFVFR